MITAVFFKKGGKFKGFRISGHSGYADPGADIVCSAVTATAQLAANAATEQFGVNARVSVDEAQAILEFSFDDDENGEKIVAALYGELTVLSGDYPENLRVAIQ